MLSITTEAAYRDLQNVPLAVGTQYGVLAGAAGENLAATLVDAPKHGSIELRADGSFQYAPDQGFAGRDRFEFRDGPDDPRLRTATIDVMTQSEWSSQPTPKTSSTSLGGLAPNSTSGERGNGAEQISVNDVTAPGGTDFKFTVTVSGITPYTEVAYIEQADASTPVGEHQELAQLGADYLSDDIGAKLMFLGDGSFDVYIGTHDLPGTTPDITSTAKLRHPYFGWAVAGKMVSIVEIGGRKPAFCYGKQTPYRC